MMNIKKQVAELASQKMDRKSFLVYTASVILSAVGIIGFIRVLFGNIHKEPSDNYVNDDSGYGYGDTPYGK